MTENLHEEFERQRRELTQSLKYASYIQRALLPPSSQLERSFREHFLLYLPRDIVSGDFYWLTKKKHITYVAVGDCTGHGVPGAFLSILGISFLNQIIAKYETISPANILNVLREHLMKSLQQTGTEQEQKDGIDMSICMLDTEKGKLEYAGAFNPIYTIHQNSSLVESPADKMPIGIGAEEERPFKNHKMALSKGDAVYLFSDGYIDQFGGEKGKKFKYGPFRSLLLEISQRPMEEQKNILYDKFLAWRSDIPQLDDVTIFGFRF